MAEQWLFKREFAKSLQEMSCERLVRMLLAVLPSENPAWKRRFRIFLQPLPVVIKEYVLEKTLESLRTEKYGSVSYPLSLNAVEALYSKGLRNIDVPLNHHFRKGHYKQLLKVVAERGGDLRRLRVDAQSFWFRHTLGASIWEEGLRTAKNLVDLSLGRLCNDELLKVIGLQCCRLQRLNIHHSPVTNRGLSLLTQNLVEVDKVNNKDWRSTFWKLPGIFIPIKKLIPPGEPEGCYVRTKNALCDTLRILELDMQRSVTYKGLMEVLELVPNLESFGPADMEMFFRQIGTLYQRYNTGYWTFTVPLLNLSSVYFGCIKESTFKVTADVCPKLRYFCNISCSNFYDPQLPLSIFNAFPCLEWLHVKRYGELNVGEDIAGLSEGIRTKLRTFGLANRDAIVPANLCFILQQCPALQNVYLRLQYVDWYKPKVFWRPSVQFQDLTCATLVSSVTANAVFGLIRYAPNLETLHVKSISEKSEDFLQRLCDIVAAPKLQVIHVHTDCFLQTQEELDIFLKHFHNVRYAGRFSFVTGYQESDELPW